MINAELLIESTDKLHRQSHLDLNEFCIERGGNSTNHKGVLAQYLNTTIPYGVKYLLCHACGNGNCSNPKHLYWGSPKENVEDAIKNGNFGMLGKGGYKKIMSEETKLKISVSHKGKVLSEETKEKLRVINTGKKHSEETKQKLREIASNSLVNKLL